MTIEMQSLVCMNFYLKKKKKKHYLIFWYLNKNACKFHEFTNKHNREEIHWNKTRSGLRTVLNDAT